MWDLPRPGLEPVSPALAGRFSTTAPPGKAFTPISDEKPQLLSSHAAGQWQSFQLQGGLFRGRPALRPLYFSSVPGLRWGDGVSPRPFPPRHPLSVSLERDCFLPSSGHQATACEFSGHSPLNSILIERNTITLGDSRAVVNTCSLLSCSILAWRSSLERIGKSSLGGE